MHTVLPESVSQLKAAVPMERLLDGCVLRRRGANRVCICPLHEERTPSFILYADGHWHCYGCGQGTDQFDYLQKRHGLTFIEAKARLAEMAGRAPALPHATRQARRPPQRKPYAITENEARRARRMAETLIGNREHIDAIANSRGWLPTTIGALAQQRSLGWHQGKLAFLYKTGVKLRWREGQERRIRWAIGKPCLWRIELIRRSHERVIMCEGETDAISLIDGGAESDGTTAVVALPSAFGFRSEWAEPMRDKSVIIALDADEAGTNGARKTADLLRGVAQSVALLNWKHVAM